MERQAEQTALVAGAVAAGHEAVDVQERVRDRLKLTGLEVEDADAALLLDDEQTGVVVRSVERADRPRQPGGDAHGVEGLDAGASGRDGGRDEG